MRQGQRPSEVAAGVRAAATSAHGWTLSALRERLDDRRCGFSPTGRGPTSSTVPVTVMARKDSTVDNTLIEHAKA
jgi:hypothetical protein